MIRRHLKRWGLLLPDDAPMPPTRTPRERWEDATDETREREARAYIDHLTDLMTDAVVKSDNARATLHAIALRAPMADLPSEDRAAVIGLVRDCLTGRAFAMWCAPYEAETAAEPF